MPRNANEPQRFQRCQQKFIVVAGLILAALGGSSVEAWSQFNAITARPHKAAPTFGNWLNSHQVAAVDDQTLLKLHFGVTVRDSNHNLKSEQLPQLPDEFGFGGPIVGEHNGALIVAGGANFPEGPPWPIGDRPAGGKVWHDEAFVLQEPDGIWTTGYRLPRPLAYAPAISTPEGVYVLGGETFGPLKGEASVDNQQGAFPTAEVLRIQWDDKQRMVKVQENALPPLPRPCSYHAAALIDTTIYVTASHAKDSQSRRLDTKAFWALDIAQSGEKRRWIELPSWPGAARHKMALVAQWSPVGSQRKGRRCLFLISGSTWVNSADGEADLSLFEHYADAYRFDPVLRQWTKLADLPIVKERRKLKLDRYALADDRRTWKRLEAGAAAANHDVDSIYARQPRPAAASPAIAAGDSHVLVFSGATGRYITLDLPDRPFFPADVLAYDTAADEWSIVGKMPLGVVTTAAVQWRERIVIPSGEVRPGVRTPHVQSFQFAPRSR